MNRYLCNKCNKSFSINHKRKKIYWIDYIDGLSLRKLSLRGNKTFKQISSLVKKEFDNLIENTYLSSKYRFKWSGTCLIDGKYISAKGYEKKIPFIYIIDYLTHDIVCGFLVMSENHEAFLKMFRLLKTVDYPLHTVVCDNIIKTLEYPLKYYFPQARIQLCHRHYLENIRKLLDKENEEDLIFLEDIRKLFVSYKNKRDIVSLLEKYSLNNKLFENILLNIYQDRDYLFLFKKKKDIPRTNNLIEVFNSHLEGRLKTIKGFNSFKSAERFLNAWMIRRRTMEFTSCVKKFSFLNGKCSLQCSLNEKDVEKIVKNIY